MICDIVSSLFSILSAQPTLCSREAFCLIQALWPNSTAQIDNGVQLIQRADSEECWVPYFPVAGDILRSIGPSSRSQPRTIVDN